jgi:hypothetical protein
VSERWFFHTDGDRIVMQARFEGDGGVIGDARDELRQGGKIKNLTYEDLKRAGSGAVVIDGETATIE